MVVITKKNKENIYLLVEIYKGLCYTKSNVGHYARFMHRNTNLI